MMIIWTHFLYVKHEHHHFDKSDKPTVHTKHKKCPICEFNFFEYINIKKTISSSKPVAFSVYYTSYINNACISKPHYSFLLRAPPANPTA